MIGDEDEQKDEEVFARETRSKSNILESGQKSEVDPPRVKRVAQTPGGVESPTAVKRTMFKTPKHPTNSGKFPA